MGQRLAGPAAQPKGNPGPARSPRPNPVRPPASDRSRATLEALGHGVLVVDGRGEVAFSNAAAARILGVPAEALPGQTLGPPAWRFVTSEGRPLAADDHPVRITLATGRRLEGRVIGVQRASEHVVWLSMSTAPLVDPGEEAPSAVVCCLTDVSAHHQDELAVATRDDQLRRTLAGAPLALWSMDQGGTLTAVFGGGGGPLAGWGDLVGRPITEVLPDGHDLRGVISRALAGETVSCLTEVEGRIFAIHVHPHHDAAGRVAGASGVALDETPRLSAEAEQAALREALRHAAAEWRATFDTIDSPVLVVSAEGVVRRVNRATQQLWGDPFEKIVGASLPDAERGAPWGAIARSVAACRESDAPAEEEESDQAADRHWDVVAVPLRDEVDVAGGMVVVARDVSRVVRLRESLRRSERMAVMGQLVGGVAHQVRNPLFGISSTLDAFDLEFGHRGELLEYSKLLRHEATRLSSLMVDLLEYGRPATGEWVETSLAATVQQAIQSCEAAARAAAVRLTSAWPDSLPQLLADPRRLREALLNLIENAIQHSPSGGEVRVRVHLDSFRGSPGVTCGVEDAGPGFRAQDLPRLFEPFFTRRGGGTGLGLSIAQRIVEEHGGRITAANRRGGGAIVTVTLPLSGPEATRGGAGA